MSNTNLFFKSKKDWSKHKDDLLSRYLNPYLSKILTTGRDVVIVDGFAGKGKFDDGTIGSPIIIKNAIYQSLSKTSSSAKIKAFFVDYQYADELRRNLSDQSMKVVSGDYRVEVPKILKSAYNKNIFLYVDPFGIKYLDFSVFEHLERKLYNSIELLLNLNSFGFIREACRVLKYNISDTDFLFDGSYESDKELNSIENMNKVAKGDYWQEIVKNYNEGKYDIFKAETIFLNQYICELKKCFKYVFCVPIKSGKSRLSKYQMIFATNSRHGALLMADNMIKCNNEIQNENQGQQIWLFDYDHTIGNCESDIFSIITNDFCELKELYIRFYEEKGLMYFTKDFNNSLKNLEKSGKVILQREPQYTKMGKVSQSMDYIKNTIKVKLNENNNTRFTII